VTNGKKIWIDLDNSPHVPFFRPIIEKLTKNGFRIVLTARDGYQTCSLADFYGLKYTKIGQHSGKNKIRKTSGLIWRTLQLMSWILKQKPDLALSHGSRAQVISATLLGVSSVAILDYEFTVRLPLTYPNWLIIPDVIPEEAFPLPGGRIRKYPGIKEDVYVPYFTPDAKIENDLNLCESDLIVTVRPPATEAHYFVPQSEGLFASAMDFLLRLPDTKIILLPRSKSQEAYVREKWPTWVNNRKVAIPEQALDGLNLLWHSDLVISGGGTMNREAAALGVPVYSIFAGKIGAVDKYLSESGRLVFIQNAEDLRRKIILSKRKKKRDLNHVGKAPLGVIVAAITDIMERPRLSRFDWLLQMAQRRFMGKPGQKNLELG
jgi:predicted glycosyltransferase